jgi:tetratricopeptide (TPR) repeat protein
MSQDFILQCIHTANIANARQDFDTAVWWCNQAIGLAPELPEAWFNLGIALRGKQQWREALLAFQKTSALTQQSAEAQNGIGYQLMEMDRAAEASACLQRAIALNPAYPLPYVNLGIICSQNRQLDEAIRLFQRAIELQPDLAIAYINLGGMLNQQKQFALAEAACRKAVELDPLAPDAWNNLGLVLMDMNKAEAAACFDQCLKLEPQFPYLQGDLLCSKLKAADWSEFSSLRDELETKIKEGERVSMPFSLLMLSGRPELQRRAAEIYTQDKHPTSELLGPLKHAPRNHQRIKLGFFSADFRTHPVSQLVCELLEHMDTSKFELLAFSFGSSAEDPLRTRIIKAVDQFIDARQLSDLQTAQLARELGIDIAIDLGGHTGDARTGVFALRSAPIQMNYLGFPGTLGASYIDYLLCDPVVCPPGSEPLYTEKLARLPHCFMPYDSTQTISDRKFTRTEFSLPDKGFVFCCFNNHHKINPEVFDVWMRLLKQVSGSVLWLTHANPALRDNLQWEAETRGIEPQRLVFAPRMELLEEHLARFRLADLFLDTWPYNAHTTACDALWAGVPVLTYEGLTFASRVAASLLTSIGLPELITNSAASYESAAIEFAAHPEQLLALRKKLAENRTSSPLFDTQRLARDMGTLFADMIEKI